MNTLEILFRTRRTTSKYTVILVQCVLFSNDRTDKCSIRVVMPCDCRREPTWQPGAKPYISNKTHISLYCTHGH